MTDRKITMPDTWLILMAIALLAWLVGWWVPGGYFADTLQVDGKSVIDPGSFRYADAPVGLPLFAEGGGMGLFNTLFEGLVAGDKWGSAIGVFAFILITGGAFGVVFATGSVEAALERLIARAEGEPVWLLPGLFFVFSLAGAVFGMGEEAIPFTLMLVPVMARLGYDKLCAVVVTYVATQVGFAASWMNPFGVAIAQGIAGVPLLSGASVRMGLWLLFTLVGMVWIARYGRRVRGSAGVVPQGSGHSVNPAPLQSGQWLVLAVLILGVAWMVWGVTQRGYYLPEIATQFFCIGLAAGLVGTLFRLNQMTANSALEAFRAGSAQLLPAAMIVAFAKGIVLLLGGDDPASPSVLNTLLFVCADALSELPAALTALGMLVFQSGFNFFVTSGSGQAALTMPLMAPLADLLGVSRQTAVLAFQLGDGFTNMLVPTSAALMGCLGAARIDWLDWIGFIWRFYLVLFALSAAAVMAAGVLGFA
ncbi:putative basic amino acid antiporter YfcC [Simiduia agarivorans]|uniref:C4-dicarboxylate anaerobic carrier n=1 Tax=Simiduia agarivorans (strain DSM 21679 / JCM 13881 / BCRC 17597 / SA1) TaxID=1117647 RepID=K4KJZ1_SIMAS|nr:putative basic amino acid antiporter YfcC [Simiduia agarivorans]AFU99316.1 hypothetical protein M5M_10685 [Simiduia agarivorans SA1 = DSM 21679]